MQVAYEYTTAGTCNPILNPTPAGGEEDYRGALPNGSFSGPAIVGDTRVIQRNAGLTGWELSWQKGNWTPFVEPWTWDAGSGSFLIDRTTPSIFGGGCTLRVRAAWNPEVWCADAALRNYLDELCPPEMDLLRWEFPHEPLWGCKRWISHETTCVDESGHPRGNFHKVNSQAAPRREGQSIRYKWSGP